MSVADFVDCTDEEAWLRVLTEEAVNAAESSGALSHSELFRSTLTRVDLLGIRGSVELGPGVIAGATLIPGRPGRAVLLRGSNPAEAASTLLRGDAEASRWRPEAAPPGLIGVSFADDRRGFVWSRREVFATEDGGAKWKAIPLGPTVIARGTDGRRPRLDGHAVLWVPTDWDGVKPGGSLWRVALDGSASVVATWDQEAIDGMSILDGGGVLVALSHFSKGGTRLIRLGSGGNGGPPKEVFRDEGSLGLLEANGVRVLLSVIGTSAPRMYFSPWPTTYMLSQDGGATWRPWTSAAVDAESLCLAPQGFWQVSREHAPSYTKWR